MLWNEINITLNDLKLPWTPQAVLLDCVAEVPYLNT